MKILTFYLTLFTGVMLFSLVSCSSKKETEENIKSVKVSIVTNASKIEKIDLPGKVKEADEAKLSFRVAGSIYKLNAKEGQYVKKGDVIAEIDPRDYIVQLAVAKAQYEQVSAEVARVEEMFKRNNISANDYEKAIAGVRMAKAQFDNATNQLNDVKLKAPFNGHIQELFFKNHETVAAGMPVLSMVDISSLEIEVFLSSSLYLRKDNIKSINYSMINNPDTIFPLEQIDITRKANSNSLYKMRLLAAGNKSSIAPGMTVNVKLLLEASSKATLLVPYPSVFEVSNKSFVWRYDSISKQVERVEVTIRTISNEGYAVVNGKLGVNDFVVSAGVHSLQDKQRVKIIK